VHALDGAERVFMLLLTPRQIEVARLLIAGQSYPEIADRLGLAKDTIKSHAEAIYMRLQVDGAVSLARDYHAQFSLRSVGSLAGYWLSRFEFKSRTLSSSGDRYMNGTQINLEHLTELTDGYFTHHGVSLCSSPSTKLTFTHIVQLKKENQVVAGIWQNTNTHNIGCMQLVVRNDSQGMQGMHLGCTSDLAVSSGAWVWRKVHASASEVVQAGATNFKPIEELEKFFEPSFDLRQKIHLKELFLNGRQFR
jgi:DNA-binding CsgD family transcriptional regulator